MLIKKDLTYYAITYGGVPMTKPGALRTMIWATAAGYKPEEVLKVIPKEYHKDFGIGGKKG